MKTYRVTINFGGFIGCEKTYEVEALDEEQAGMVAFEEASNYDLYVEDIEIIKED